MSVSPEALRDLANRCESERPSRLLDAEIAVALRLRPVGKLNAWIDENFPVWRAREDGHAQVVDATGDDGAHWEVASYTASLDAAVTLVPEEWYVYEIRQMGPRDFYAALGPSSSDEPEAQGYSGTEPMARCAAALRARAAIAESEG